MMLLFQNFNLGLFVHNRTNDERLRHFLAMLKILIWFDFHTYVVQAAVLCGYRTACGKVV